ncbi:Concanavalin A-like lectin/glucanases superfamily [Pelomyxa schiedti]|nr:Concanavalin A-like lectin/glucanases superfamily [Pelomyxa schiedti]
MKGVGVAATTTTGVLLLVALLLVHLNAVCVGGGVTTSPGYYCVEDGWCDGVENRVNCPRDCRPDDEDQARGAEGALSRDAEAALLDAWKTSKQYYVDLIVGQLEKGNPYSLYDAELMLNNFCKYIRMVENDTLLGDLAEVLLSAEPYLNTTYGYKEWLCETPNCLNWPASADQEVLLVSSQFVYILAEVLYGIASMGLQNQEPFSTFVSKYATVVWFDELYKWIHLGTTFAFPVQKSGSPPSGTELGLHILPRFSAGLGYTYLRGGTSELTLGNWHHVVVSYDGSNVNFYVNGTSHTRLHIPGIIVPDSGSLYIGRYISGSWAYFNGSIDEVYIYNRVLSQEEVDSRYSGEEIDAGLAGSWKFEDDESSGAILDSSGNNNTGTPHNTVYLPSNMCWAGKCLGFNGIDSHIVIPNSVTLNMEGWAGFTLEAWVKPVWTTVGSIICKGWQSGYSGFELQVSASHTSPVSDTDMWVISGAIYTLSTYRIAPDVININESIAQVFSDFIEMGRIFIEGVWDDYFDYRYSNYTEDVTEGYNPADLGIPIKPGKNVGWDISHARRFCHVFYTFDECRAYLTSTFPDNIYIGLTNEVIYRVFNRNWTYPLFTNFMDGTNGWYRVDYSGRPHFGYSPWELSGSYPTGGYGLWSKYNQDTSMVLQSLWKALTVPFVYDDTGKGTKMTLSAGTTWVGSGISGGGIHVENTEKLSFSLPLFGESGASVSLWVKLDNGDPLTVDLLTLWQGNGYTDFVLLRKNPSGQLCVLVEKNDTTVVYTCSVSTSSLLAGEWHHIAITSNTSQVLIYVDGTVVSATGTNSGTFIPQWVPIVFFWIGSTHWTYMNGTLDNVAVYDRALTPSDIVSLYELTSDPSDIGGCMACWGFASQVSPKDPSVTQFWGDNYGSYMIGTSAIMFLPSLAQRENKGRGSDSEDSISISRSVQASAQLLSVVLAASLCVILAW